MKPSELFTEMAVDIDRNEGKFGGAFVIVPPAMGGDPVGRLVISKSDQPSAAIHFWALVQTEVQAMLEKLKEQERGAAAFGRR